MCPKFEDSKNSDILSCLSCRYAWYEDGKGLKTYCLDCNTKLERINEGQCSRILCVSDFCQMTTAQCQLCKIRFEMDKLSCPVCFNTGLPKIMGMFTAKVKIANSFKSIDTYGMMKVSEFKQLLKTGDSTKSTDFELKVDGTILADDKTLNFYRITCDVEIEAILNFRPTLRSLRK